MYATPVREASSGTKTIWPLAAICCLAFVGFLIAATIVVALIPIYLPKKQESPLNNTASADDEFYIQYTADTNVSSNITGKVQNLAQVGNALNLGNTAEIISGDAQETFQRRKRSALTRRHKRALIMKFRFKCRPIYNSLCTSLSCRKAARSQIQSRIQQIGNIPNFPIQILSGGVLKSLIFSLAFSEILQPGITPIGFGTVTSLIFVAIRSGAFNDPLTWADGIVPYDDFSVVIPAGISVTLARDSLELHMHTCDVYGSLVLGSGSSSFTFQYPPNIIVHSGGTLEDLTSSKLLHVPPFSLITLYPNGGLSAAGTVLQTSSSGESVTLSSSGPFTYDALSDGEVLSFNKVTYIVAASGGFTLGSTFLGGIPPSADTCSAVGGCDIYVPSGYTLSTADLNNVENIEIDVISVPSGGIFQLGVPGSSSDFKFLSSVELDISGELSFVGSGGRILVPLSSAINFLSGSIFNSVTTTIIQVFNPSSGILIGTPLTLGTSLNGPYYVTITSSGTILLSNTSPGGDDLTTTTAAAVTSAL